MFSRKLAFQGVCKRLLTRHDGEGTARAAAAQHHAIVFGIQRSPHNLPVTDLVEVELERRVVEGLAWGGEEEEEEEEEEESS